MYKRRRFRGASSRIKRRSKAKHFFSVLFKVGLPAFLFASAIYVLRADFIQLKKVEISGNKEIKTEQIEKLALNSMTGNYFWFIPKSNMLLFDEKDLAAKILEEFKRAESAKVSKSVRGSLEVAIKERRGDFIWCSASEECFLMDRNGLIFVDALRKEIAGKIIFRGGIAGDPIMKNFTEAETMQNYLKASEILGNAGFNVLSINLELPNKAVFETETGDIFLNPEEDLSDSVSNAILLITEIKSKNPSAIFEYIDARFGNKVFYKLQS